MIKQDPQPDAQIPRPGRRLVRAGADSITLYNGQHEQTTDGLVTAFGASAMHSQIAYFAPRDPGYVIDVSGAAVVKSSQHQAAAQKFLAFLVSKQGEEIIGRAGGDEQSYEYPIGSGVTTSAPETPFNQLQPNPITIAQLGDGAAAIDLLRRAGLL